MSTEIDSILTSLHPWAQQLYAAYKSDELIDEVGYTLPAMPQQDLASNAVVVTEEHKLGVACAALPQIYFSAKSALIRLVSLMRRIDTTTALQVVRAVDVVTTCVLLVNAEYALAWRLRKQCMIAQSDRDGLRNQCMIAQSERRNAPVADDVVADTFREFRFISVVLSKYPKSGLAWAYRGWVLRRRLRHLAPELGAFVRRENELCRRTLRRYQRCYFVWLYKLELLRAFTSIEAEGFSVEEELQASYQWLTQNVSDYSAVSYIQQLLLVRAKGEEPAIMIPYFARQLAVVDNIIQVYPFHQSLWSLKLFLCTHIAKEAESGKVVSVIRERWLALEEAQRQGKLETGGQESPDGTEQWWKASGERYARDLEMNTDKTESAVERLLVQQVEFSFQILQVKHAESTTESKNRAAPLTFLVHLLSHVASRGGDQEAVASVYKLVKPFVRGLEKQSCVKAAKQLVKDSLDVMRSAQ